MSDEKTLGEAFGEELRKKHQAMMRDALRFRALEAELSNKGHLLSTMLASLDYKYDCPETLAELADKLIAEMKEVGK